MDQFLCPSNFCSKGYVDWGIPRERLKFEVYGRILQPTHEVPVENRREPTGLGQISPYKGVEILLKAMARLQETAPDVHLYLHGANIDALPPGIKEYMIETLEQAERHVCRATCPPTCRG